jgi:ABC-type dipeptide/oligopeptide/nickel transport system ATPase subunit
LVHDATFHVDAGETVAIVGESGSGKSLSALAVMGLLADELSIAQGTITFEGRDLSDLDDEQMRQLRGSGIAMIFQEPMTSLNPVKSIGKQLTEGMRLNQGYSRRDARDRAVALLEEVGVSDAVKRLKQYPHQLSGGMRQRVMIAIALACKPRLILADEPTTALDVTIQAQILSLTARLCHEHNVGLLLITCIVRRAIPTRADCWLRCLGLTLRAMPRCSRLRDRPLILCSPFQVAGSIRAADSPASNAVMKCRRWCARMNMAWRAGMPMPLNQRRSRYEHAAVS